MFTNVPSFTARPVTATLTPCAFLLSVIDVALSVWPAIVSVTVPVEATANVGVAPVVSKSTLNAPSKATFGMSTVIAAVIEPVTPPVVLPGEVANSRKPVAIVTAIRRVVPELMAISAFEMSRRVLFVSLVNTKSPLSETPASASVTPVPETANLRVAAISSLVSKPLSVNVSFTSALVVLTSRPSVPCSVTPGTFCSATVPCTRPATPPLRISQKPLPPVSVSRSCLPSPSARLTLASASLTVGPALVVSCSIETSALRRWPATRTVTPTASTFRYGAAVSIFSAKLPPSCRSPALTARVALSVPETRAGAIVRLPLMASTLTAPPARLIAPSVTVSLSSVPERSTTIEPLSSWPTTVSFALATSTRRYAAGSVVSVVSVTVPVRATFGTLSASVALTEPLMPAALIVKRRRALLGDGQASCRRSARRRSRR